MNRSAPAPTEYLEAEAVRRVLAEIAPSFVDRYVTVPARFGPTPWRVPCDCSEFADRGAQAIDLDRHMHMRRFVDADQHDVYVSAGRCSRCRRIVVGIAKEPAE